MSDSDSSDSEVYIPKNPLASGIVEGTRDRKKVERYHGPATQEKAEKPVVIPNGKGTKLKDIPTVNSNLDKLKASDDIAKGLHRLLFGGKIPNVKSIKNNIQEEAVEEKLGRWLVGGLRELVELFNLETGGDKDAIIARLMTFLKNPKDSGLVPKHIKAAQEAKEKKAKKLALKKAKLAAKEKKLKEKKAKALEAKKAAAEKKKAAAALAKAKKAAASGKLPKPPKKRSGFDIYAREHQKEVKDAAPDASRADIIKTLADKWETVSAEAKAEYEEKAKAENAKNEEKHAKALEEAKKVVVKKKEKKTAEEGEEKKKTKKAAKKEEDAPKEVKAKKEKTPKEPKEKKEKAPAKEPKEKKEKTPKEPKEKKEKAAEAKEPKAKEPKAKKAKAEGSEAAASTEKKPKKAKAEGDAPKETKAKKPKAEKAES
ncbi:hypothetical protein BGW41_004463, partial [Actinomortierella wolfii]